MGKESLVGTSQAAKIAAEISTPLTPVERQKLAQLATEYDQFEHPNTAIESP
jgi:hypothetical protein